MPATLPVSDVLQHSGEKQDCERNAAMATLNQPGPPQEIDEVRFEIAGGDGFGIAEP